MIRHTLLTFNPGSSTIKFGLYALDNIGAMRVGRGMIDLRHTPLCLHITKGATTADIPLAAVLSDDLHEVIEETLGWLTRHFPDGDIRAIGHHVVHGGDRFAGAELVNDEVIDDMAALTPLAPLHRLQSLHLIRAVRHLRPDVRRLSRSIRPSTAHKATSFVDLLCHAGCLIRGSSGMASTAYLISVSPAISPDWLRTSQMSGSLWRIWAAAPVFARSRMGGALIKRWAFPRSTPFRWQRDAVRSTPGLFFSIVASTQSPWRIYSIITRGVSASPASARMRGRAAHDALDLFVLKITQENAALATTLGGFNGIVFTAGIGEHQPAIREAVCRRLAWLGVAIEPSANDANCATIGTLSSKVAVLVIPTDEEQVIADEALATLNHVRPAN